MGRSTTAPAAAVPIVLCLLLVVVFCDESTHKYEKGEEVVLWVNKIGPYHNPQETYTYYTLPFCRTSEVDERKWGGLGEVLEGNELIKGDFPMKFRENVNSATICTQTLDELSAQFFAYAVESHYWYQFYIDDLPIWGMTGEMAPDEDPLAHDASKHDSFYMYTHKKFVIGYNEDRIIEVTLTPENPQVVEEGRQITWTYSVQWVETDTPFSKRFLRYLDNDFFEHQIHWFSIFNSFMMVIFLTGLVSLILMRTLRNDYARFAKDNDDLEDMSRDMGEDFGWKQLQGDVFRFPPHTVLFSACVGTGVQLVLVITGLLILAVVGTLYSGRGAIINAFILCYSLSSCVSGYISGSYYAKSKGPHWIKTMVLTASLLPMVVVGVVFPLNFIAIGYTSLAAIPFGTMIVILVIWALVVFPLTLLGTVLGRNWGGNADFPCRVHAIPRHIPEKKWYLQTSVVILLGGILPFGSIFIEMYFVFSSFWNYKFYYVYGFMMLVFVILCIVSSCVTIVSTYFLLNAEDYRWPWTSFLSSASISLYVGLYAVYYFMVKTKMHGLFQTFFYFGYTFMFCCGLGLMCGSIGFWGAYFFVKRIYQNIKGD